MDSIDDAGSICDLRALAAAGGVDEPLEATWPAISEALGMPETATVERLRALEASGYVNRDTAADHTRISITSEGVDALIRKYQAYRSLFRARCRPVFVGRVVEGLQEASEFVSLPGYAGQFRDRLDYDPFPGTLNLTLGCDTAQGRRTLDRLDGITIESWTEGDRTYGAAMCYPAELEVPDSGQVYDPAHVFVPDRTEHDDDEIELLAPRKLRDVFDIDDGDVVAVRPFE